MQVSIPRMISTICLTFVGLLTPSLSAEEINTHKESMQANKKLLLNVVLQGRYDFLLASAVHSPLPNANFQETSQRMLYSTGIDCAAFNGVVDKDKFKSITEEEVNFIISFFKRSGSSFIWWTDSELSKFANFQFAGNYAGIALDISHGLPEKPTSIPSLEISTVQSEEDLKAFSQLAILNSLGDSPELAEQFFRLNSSMGREKNQISIIARLNGKSVGTVILSTCQATAGIWALSTSPEYRHQGIGGTLVYAALIEAKKRGYEQVMALVEPKGMAWGLFKKMGFDAFVQMPCYAYAPSTE